MAMVNQIPNPAMALPYNLANVKDSRWLTLEVCREFQRNKCSRTETECKFAHPPPNVEVQNGRVTCCFDSIKGKCQRKDPPCKYLHPPQHLREQLLQNGKNNLILRNLQMQVAQFGGLQPLVPNVIPFAHHYPSPVQTAAAYSPYGHMSPAPGGPGMPATSVHAVVSSADSQPALSQGQILYSNPQVANAGAAKVTRPDRLEVCREWQRASCTRSAAECRFAHPPDHVLIDCAENQVTVCMDFIKGKCCRDTCRYFHPPQHLANQIKAAQQRLAASQTMQANLMISGRMDTSQLFQEQLPDTLPICRDFKLGQCGRPHCKYVHIREENVEVYDGKVIVCRDYLKGKCMRASCKYFHQNPDVALPQTNGRSPHEGL